MIDRLISFVSRRRWWIIIGTIAVTCALAPWFMTLRLGASTSGFQPLPNDPERLYLEGTYEDFGSDKVFVIAVISDDVFSSATLSVVRRLNEEIEKLPSVEHVQSITNAPIIKSKHDEIFVKDIMRDMPATAGALEQFRKDILNNPLYANNLISNDHRATVMHAFIDVNAPEDVVKSTVDSIEEIVAHEKGGESIYFAGTPAMAAAIFRMLSADLTTYVPITLLIITIIILINFRSWLAALMTLVTVSMASMFTYAIMAIMDVPIFTLTATIPPIIAALGTSCSIHLFTEYLRHRAEDSKPLDAMELALKGIILAIWLSILTTGIGFASLLFMHIVAIRQLSLFLVVGMVFIFALVTLFIPAVLALGFTKAHPLLNQCPPTPHQPYRGMAGMCLRRRFIIFLITGAIAVVCGWGASRLTVETDLNQLFRPSSKIRQAVDVITERLHGITTVSVIIDGGREGAFEDPAVLDAVDRLQSVLDAQSTVSKTISVADYLKVISRALHNNNQRYYALPRTKEAAAQYLLTYSLADSQRTMDRYIDYDRRLGKIWVRSSLTSSKALLDFRRFIDDQCIATMPAGVSCKVTSDSMLIAETSQNLSQGILVGFSVAAMAIFIIIVILFRSIKMGVIAMIPNLLPLLFILGLMGWADIPFNIGTSIVICIAIGIAVDDTIHFLVRFLFELRRTNHYLVRSITGARITEGQRYAIVKTLCYVRRPIVLTSVAIFLGFAVLGFSQFVPVMLFGILTSITMVYCLICDLIVLPALLCSVSI